MSNWMIKKGASRAVVVAPDIAEAVRRAAVFGFGDPDSVVLFEDKALIARQRRQLAALADRVAEASGQQCPDCRSRDIEDNGQSGRWLEYRCVACDRRFGPGAEA